MMRTDDAHSADAAAGTAERRRCRPHGRLSGDGNVIDDGDGVNSATSQVDAGGDDVDKMVRALNAADDAFDRRGNGGGSGGGGRGGALRHEGFGRGAERRVFRDRQHAGMTLPKLFTGSDLVIVRR